MTIGIANSKYPENKHPGKMDKSTGYMSRDGKMYYSNQFDGNLLGERYEEGIIETKHFVHTSVYHIMVEEIHTLTNIVNFDNFNF